MVQEKGDLLVHHISRTHVDFVNGLRRSILNHVPTVAISTVHVLTNHSVAADEFLSHHLEWYRWCVQTIKIATWKRSPLCWSAAPAW